MVPLSPIISITFILIVTSIIDLPENRIFITNTLAITFLAFLSSIAGAIVFMSFIITRIWRRLL